MITFQQALIESLNECSSAHKNQKVKSVKTTPEGYLNQVLSMTFLKISAENCPKLSTIPDTVVETLESLNSTFHQKQSEELRDLCFKVVGDYKECYKDTLLFRAVVEAEQPNVELIQKLFKAGFDKNAALINFVFKAVQQFTSNEEEAKIVAIILHYKKSIEPEDISKAIKSNNLTLLNLYFEKRSKWTGKSIPADDINTAIELNFLDAIKVCSKFDKNFETKILSKDKKTGRSQFLELAVQKSDIKTIKYMINMLENNETKEIFLRNIIDDQVIDIAETRVKNCPNDDTKAIYNYLCRKLEILNNQKKYLQNLFQLDSDNIKKIQVILNKLCNMYKKNDFFYKKLSSPNDSTDDLSQLFEYSDVGLRKKDYEYEVVTQLKKVATLIGLLGTHDGGIQEKFSMIPWRELKRLSFVMANDHSINQLGFLDARKLLEQISPDFLKLRVRLGDLIKAYSEGWNPSFEKFSKIKKTKESIKLHNVYQLTKKSIDFEVITFTLEHIIILESLHFKNVNHRCAFIQCLQNIGERYNQFSSDTLTFLKKFDFIKKLRNEIAHIWNKHKTTKKFLSLLERNDPSQDKITTYFNDLRHFIVTTYKGVLVSVEENYGNLSFDPSKVCGDKESDNFNPRKFLKCLESVSISPEVENNIPFTDSLVDRQVNLIKYIITHIQNVIKKATYLKSYREIRDALKLPVVHLKCVLILTIIGESIHSIKNEDDYLSVAEFALLKELDFLKWVRNALMHLDNIDERGTLIDYFSNDLLMEFSISTHGQKIVELSKYFDYLVQLIDHFQKTRKNLLEKGNFLQNYTGQDQLFLNFDFKKKTNHIQKTKYNLDHSKRLWIDSDINDFTIKMLLTNKVEIETEGEKLKINILGLFGKLPIRGFISSGDMSGILVSIHEDSFLDKIAEFKQFVCNKLNYRLMVVEVRQLEEYLESKVANKIKVDDYKQKFVETATKYSLNNLENNIALINALARGNIEHLLLNEFNVDLSQLASGYAPLQLATEQFSKVVTDVGTGKASGFQDQESKVKPLDCLARNASPFVTPLQSAIEEFCKLTIDVANDKGSKPQLKEFGSAIVNKYASGRTSRAWAHPRKRTLGSLACTTSAFVTPLQAATEEFSKLTIDVTEEKASALQGKELKGKPLYYCSDKVNKHISDSTTQARICPREKACDPLFKVPKLVSTPSGLGPTPIAGPTDPFVVPLPSIREEFPALKISVDKGKASELQDEVIKGKNSSCSSGNINCDVELFSNAIPKMVKEMVSDHKGNEVTGNSVNYCTIDVNEISFDLSLVTYKTEFSSRQKIFSGPVIHQLYNIYAEYCDTTFNGHMLELAEEILNRGVELFAKQDRKGIEETFYKLPDIIESAGGEIHHEVIQEKKTTLLKEIESKRSDIYAEQNYCRIRDNILGFLKEILDRGAYLAERQRSRRIKDNILRLVKDILDRGANVNSTDPYWNKTILHRLCQEYDEAFFTLLTETNNLNVNLHDCAERVPLETAFEYNNSQLIEFLKYKTDYKESLLIAATKAGSVKYIEYLTGTFKRNFSKISFNIQDEDGTPIVYCAILKSKRYDDNIIRANDERYRQVMKLLVENGAEVVFFEDRHPLRWSLENDDIDLSLFFAEHTTDLHIYHPRDGILPIHQAILNIQRFPEKREGYIRIIKQIAAKSADKINSELRHGSDTPLFLAAKQNDFEVMKILIDSGADINYKPYRIRDIVGIENSKQIIEFFIDNSMIGAHKYLDQYKNVFNFCNSRKLKELKQLIIEQSLSVNTMDSGGRNLLWYAISEKDVDFIKWLSSKGASLNLDLTFFLGGGYSKYAETYYDVLCSDTNGPILQALQENGAIKWEYINGRNIKFICIDALQNDDLEAIQILEEHKYLDITTENLKPGKVKEYLISYSTVFSQIKERSNIQQLKNQIMELKNKSVLFDGSSLLHDAVSENHLDLIKFLLSDVNVFNANILDYGQKSALDWSVEKRSKLNVIKILIDKMIKITTHLPIEEYLSLRNEDTESVEKYNVILKYIIDNSDLKNILFEHAFEDKYLSNPEFYSLLLELGWDPNEYENSSSIYNGGQTVLHKCAYEGLDCSIKIICDSKKVDFELPCLNTIVWYASGPVTAVGFALENGKFKSAKLLIEYGASPYKYLQLLLLSALYEGDVIFTNLLLRKSVVYDSEETKSYLNVWLRKSFDGQKVLQAMSFFHNNEDKIVDMPNYIYDNLANIALDMVEQNYDFLNTEGVYTALYLAAEQKRWDIFENLVNDRTKLDSLTPEQKQKLLIQAEESSEKNIIDFLSVRLSHLST